MGLRNGIRLLGGRATAVLVAVALAVTGLLAVPSSAYADEDGAGECIVGTSTIRQCFGRDVAAKVVRALQAQGVGTTLRDTSVLSQAYADMVKALNLPDAPHIKNLEKLTNLEELTLTDASTPSEEFAVLRSLKKLTKLTLAAKQFKNIEYLDQLHNLKDLSIKKFAGEDKFDLLPRYSPGLERLRLETCKIGATVYDAWLADSTKPKSNIAWIAQLHNLTSVSLSDNDIQDPSGLGALTSLKELNLDSNHIIDISSLSSLLTQLDAFSADEQVCQYPDYQVSNPGESYKIYDAVVADGNPKTYAPITGSDPVGGDVNIREGYVEWRSPKADIHGLGFSALVGGSKNFKFEGFVNQVVKVKVIFFDVDGTTEIGSEVIGTPSSVPFPTRSKVGYTPCWQKDGVTGCLPTDYKFDSASEVKLTWVAKKYKATFVTHKSDVSNPPDQVIEYDGKVTAPEDPKSHGYDFKGWSLNENGAGSNYDFANTLVTGDVTLHAQWEKHKFNVDFKDSVGGSTLADRQSVPFQEHASAPTAPTKVGHTFKGWTLDKEGKHPFDIANDPVTDDIVLHAQWDVNKYDVKFETGSPSVAAPPVQSVDYNGTAKRPADPVRPGYVFEGWGRNEDGTDPYPFDDAVTNTITLHAKWKKAKVHFDEQNGTPVFTTEPADNGIPGKPANPVREGFEFVGWSLSKDGSTPFNFDSALPDGTTVYGIWKRIVHPVQFDTQGGSNVSSQSVAHGDLAFKPADPVRKGYRFKGWTSDPEGHDPFDFSARVISARKAYAQWEKVDDPVGENSKNDPARHAFNSKKGPSTFRGALAHTGVGVLAVLVMVVALLAAGVALVLIRKRKDDEPNSSK
ncbi:Listeria/Bacterioides repeat-containing protein [Bifidobacterium commune]|uniref:Listeria/Bacterioides repeat-containing protein n=1 Tax=Bifidobacterium commune TaxID=1505727 RepID=A0A1C4H5N7_9BIFI|nr:InlB B-repeat-containing protein [Bifidobacterium commune]SCC80101.1 Listeria/Bacterioides repeat-containing protein [Bifidobacterium commune]